MIVQARTDGLAQGLAQAVEHLLENVKPSVQTTVPPKEKKKDLVVACTRL
jgi:hypothetical protein